MDYLLIWDIDGTLVAGKGVARKVMNRAFHELYGVDNAFDGINMAGMLDTAILSMTFEKAAMPPDPSGRFYGRYTALLEEAVMNERPYSVIPGIAGLLEILDGRNGFYNVLGTGNLKETARIKLRSAGIDGYFRTGGFSDGAAGRSQVIAAAVSNARRLFGIEFDAGGIFVIGDTPLDIKCAHDLGVSAIGVATGSYSAGNLKESGADYVFDNFLDPRPFLRIFD